ncbi:MAG: hypothetical protein JWQ40_2276 [Segetibacter sp.]|nr:hypothetical protein [Segetibacter sp.]
MPVTQTLENTTKKDQHVYQGDNRWYRIWYLRKLYFNILVKQLPKLGFVNAARTQFPFAFKDAIAPPSLSVEFTNYCNLSCTYCTSPLNLRPKGLMSDYIFDRVVEGIVDCEVKRVRVIGNGEAGIHPNYKEYIKELRRVTSVISLTTNAKFNKEAFIYDTIDAGFDQLNISVDSDNKNSYEKLRVRGNFEKLVGDLKKLKEYKDGKKSKTMINIRVMISPEDFDRQKEIMDFWKPFADVISKQYVIDINDLHTDTFATDARNGRFPACSLPFKTLDIQWNGNIPLCSYSFKQSGLPEGVLIGNIGKTSLQEIWNGPLIKQYRDAHRSRNEASMPLCNNCMGT